MKKRVLLLFIVSNVVVILALAGLFVLSEAYPLRPGTALYKIQHVAEQWRMRLSAGEAGRATVAVELAERRLADLAQAGSERRSQAAAVAFDRALSEAVRRVEGSPEPEQAELQAELVALLGRAEIVLEGLQPAGEGVVVATLQRQVASLQESSGAEEVVAAGPEPVELMEAEPIPFLSQDIDHTVWPLTGGHGGLACEECHQAGVYAGTVSECGECHALPESELYAEHFAGECLECHLVDSWAPSEFDHEEIVDCQSCHEDESPAEHYARSNDNWWLLTVLSNRETTPAEGSLLEGRHYDRCADCHTSTEEWGVVEFDHFGFTDCQACHELEGEVAVHYEGQCSLCHSTGDWEPLAFEHANVGECRACHAQDSPGEHYLLAGESVWFTAWQPDPEGRHAPGLLGLQETRATCGNCHVDTEDWRVVEFDHGGYYEDCESCHAREGELENHYGGECSNCHVVDNWEELDFDHEGYSDCQDCHSLEEGHYPDQCSLCHSIDNWQSVEFSHRGFAACTSCHEWETPEEHYDRPCALCHTTNEWSEIIFQHKSGDNCRSCHVTEFDHYRGQCSLCHNTNSWSEATQPHSGLIGCGACHTSPAGHYAGVCVECHSASSWEEVDYGHANADDCRVCHTSARGHYPAQCSACHNVENWTNYYVNHVALVSCSTCHEAPGGHWLGECSLCHDSETWTEIIYTHYVSSDCGSCHRAPVEHWPGQCSLCHNMTNWTEVRVDHTILTDCLSCHVPPAGHWPGQCSLCHNTSNWAEYTFNHTGYDNCVACHTLDRPAGHDRGQCSKCHNTSSWVIPATPTPTLEPPTPTPTEVPPTPEPAPTVQTEATPTPGIESVAP